MEKQRAKLKLPSEQGFGDFPGGPVAKTLSSQCRGPWVQSRCHAAQLSIQELKNLWAEDIQLLPLSDLQFQGLRSPVVNERALGSYHTACAAHTLVLWPHR